MAGFTWDALSGKLLDWGRYEAIARAFFITGISFTQGLVDVRVGMHLKPGAVSSILLAVYSSSRGSASKREIGLSFLGRRLLLTMLAGYFFIYVMTPLDLGYHLITSLNRLFLQLWPSIILLAFMIARTPEESSPTSDGPCPAANQATPGKGKKRQRNQEVT